VALPEAQGQRCDEVVVEDEVRQLVQATYGVREHGEAIVGDVENAQVQHLEHVTGNMAQRAAADVERQSSVGLFHQKQVSQQLVGGIGLNQGRWQQRQGVSGNAQRLK
jgi:hypothetical protein